MIMQSVTELAAARKAILDSVHVDEATDLKWFKSLCAVENRIAEAAYQTIDDKRAGNLILMECSPQSWDEFQSALCVRMQQFN
jgi:hypothetical protein